VTYTKTNPRTGQIYIGHTMGYGTVLQILAVRDAGHHIRGYLPAQPDTVSDATRPWWDRHRDPAYRAMRGREQQLIDELGGAQSERRTPPTRAGNAIRGVAKANPRGRLYHAAATAFFGQRAPYTGY
jgi:hypothetical protein